MSLPTKIFNVNKTYGNDSLFFGDDPGLFDDINVKYPDILACYEKIKASDWDKAEWNYTQDNLDFKNVNRSMYESMLFNLIYQTAADSVASRSIAPVLQQVITNSELNAAVCILQSQEVLHASSYSFAIRNCFDDPQGVIKEAEKLVQAHSRLETIAGVFEEARVASFEYSLGRRTKEETYPKIMNMVVALFALEAIQFINSFAITGAFYEASLFKSVGAMVKRIMTDETNHATLDKMIIQHELKTEIGQKWLADHAEDIKQIIDEVVQSERDWTKFIFSDGRQVPGLNEALVNHYINFISQNVYSTLKIKHDWKTIREIPLPYMLRYGNLSNEQASPQEQAERGAGSYLIGRVVDDGVDNVDMEI